MDEDLAQVQFEYLKVRVSELGADVRQAEAASGMRATPENARTAATLLIGIIKQHGNAWLAHRYQSAFADFDSSVTECEKAFCHDDAKAMRLALDTSDEAEEQFERVASEVMAWFEAMSD